MQQVQEIHKVELVDILEKVVDEMQDWLIIGDQYGKIMYANSNVYTSCDCTKEEVLGKDMCMFVGVDLSDQVVLNKINKFLKDGEKFEFVTNRFIKGNKRIYLTNTLTTIWYNNQLEYFVCLSKDITNTEKLKAEVYRANYIDPLTNLPNQRFFLQSLYKAVQKVKSSHTQLAVIIVDIRKIGEINENYGMNVGDIVIKAVTKRLRNILNDKQEMFRYGDGSFIIIHQYITGQEDVEILLRQMNEKIKEPISVHNSYLYIEAKEGIALFPNDAKGASELIKNAEIALAKVKREKPTIPYIFYTKDIHEEIESSMLFEAELKIAVQNEEFVVYYQPFIDLKTNTVVGMEALLRQIKHNGEMVLPNKFIGVLEQMNLIEKVGIMVIEKVCIQLRRWLDKGYKVVPISVNLSALQFKNPNLAKNIIEILEHYNIKPGYIILEITESTVMEDIGLAHFTLNELKDYGFCISIDDFGTGYASIGYLKKFMFNHLKIDISFIKEITKNNQDRAIVEAIISIAKSLHLTTIAEGIEDEEQLAVMSEMGCEIGQGFLWDKPISSTQIEEKYLKRNA
ncbi:hypothetical protein CS063_00695 [Sporanaerobium hydrogeniformans]|uniref:Uncharacterized protein n=1 Tax=Sporanaerobium hydrogeniformans TaxID=3072179 RepID=A0AC61DGT0_9FIRM|nr:GGDEF domain-containing phosphodiesterase [Sporanaerobium hydrogeniformans]PHV72028.1 hypothetical protein CS063_00695 [Sporanaerobium hydrogeniformans]